MFNTTKTITLRDGLRLKIKQKDVEFQFEFKDCINLILLKEGLNINQLTKDIGSLDLEVLKKTNIVEFLPIVDKFFKTFILLDTDKGLRKHIFDALDTAVLIEGDKDYDFTKEIFIEKGLVEHYYTIIIELIKIYFIPFYLPLFAKLKPLLKPFTIPSQSKKE